MIECPQCFSEITDDGAMECPVCGQVLKGQAEAPAEATPAGESEILANFRRQFEERSVTLPQRALERASEILKTAGEELRRATVIFVDLVGYSRLSLEVNPEELSKIAREFYGICQNCIIRRGGFVVKYAGDAVMAVFGAPVAYDRDVESAVLAALDIREQYLQLAGSGERRLAVSIGLATGTLRSGLIDGPSGKVYDVLGDTVNLAARLQGAAGENEALICQTTKESTYGWFETEETEPLKLKNISDHYVAFRVLRRHEREPARRSFDTPYCGREREVQTILGFIRGEAGRMAHVMGEAGMGKSRLVYEALGRANARDRSLWWEGAPAYSSILLWPVLEWLRKDIGLTREETPETIRSEVRRYLARRLPDADFEPTLLEYVFGLREAVGAMRGIPGDQIQRNVFALLHALVRQRRNGDGRAIIVLDDAQWFDELTGELVRTLIDWPADGEEPLLILIYRSGSEVPVQPRPGEPVVRLHALAERERHALMQKLVPSEALLPEVRRTILTRAAGNPLFIEEMTRLVDDTLAIKPSAGEDTLTERMKSIIPETLGDLIQSRIDRLEAGTRQVLQCASLLGLDFVRSLIELFDVVRRDLAEQLQTLRGMQYLRERDEIEDVHYYFTHGLYREVAYSTLLEEQKRQLHATLAERLEQAFADRLPEHYEELAMHYRLGENTKKAVYYLVKAAERQEGLGGSRAAVRNYEEAIELLREDAEAPANRVLMTRCLTRCGHFYRTLGEGERCDAAIDGALQIADALDNERLAVEACLAKAEASLARGEGEAILEELKRIRADAIRLGNHHVEVESLLGIASVHQDAGRYDAARTSYRQLHDRVRGLGLKYLESGILSNMALILWRQGEYDDALQGFQQALGILNESGGDIFDRCRVLMHIGIIQEQRGRLDAARRSYENAARLAEKTGYAQGVSAIESNRSNVERRAGSFLEAEEHATNAIDWSRRAQDPLLESIAEENAGLAAAARGNLEGGRIHIERAIELARKIANQDRETEAGLSLLSLTASGIRVAAIDDLLAVIREQGYGDLMARALRLRGLALLEADADAAASCFRESLEQARETGNFFDEMDAWEALARGAEKQGDEKEMRRCRERVESMRRGVSGRASDQR